MIPYRSTIAALALLASLGDVAAVISAALFLYATQWRG